MRVSVFYNKNVSNNPFLCLSRTIAYSDYFVLNLRVFIKYELQQEELEILGSKDILFTAVRLRKRLV